MARHRIHSLAFKKQVVQEYAAGATLHGLAREYASISDTRPPRVPRTQPALFARSANLAWRLMIFASSLISEDSPLRFR